MGSSRREWVDHLVVLSQRHLRCLLKGYFVYYQWSRTHLALAKDAPEPRAIMRQGEIIAIPQVGCAPQKVDATSRSNFFEPIFMVQPAENISRSYPAIG